jgi:hypothetical protein
LGRDTIALHLSAEKKDETAVRWLIAHGIDVSAKRTLWDCHYTPCMSPQPGAVESPHAARAGADPAIHDDKYDATVLGWRTIASSRRWRSAGARDRAVNSGARTRLPAKAAAPGSRQSWRGEFVVRIANKWSRSNKGG